MANAGRSAWSASPAARAVVTGAAPMKRQTPASRRRNAQRANPCVPGTALECRTCVAPMERGASAGSAAQLARWLATIRLPEPWAAGRNRSVRLSRHQSKRRPEKVSLSSGCWIVRAAMALRDVPAQTDSCPFKAYILVITGFCFQPKSERLLRAWGGR